MLSGSTLMKGNISNYQRLEPNLFLDDPSNGFNNNFEEGTLSSAEESEINILQEDFYLSEEEDNGEANHDSNDYITNYFWNERN